MDTISSQCKSIMCIKRCCHFLEPIIKSKVSFYFFMDIYVRDLQNDMIKPYYNGGLASVFDSTTQKLLISDTTLRPFIPPKLRKMTPKLRYICIYELCIITKYTHIDLNIYITIIVTDLQQKFVGRYTHTSLFRTKSDAHLKI